MKITRNVLLTAGFLLLAGLLIVAADKYYNLLFLFYPSLTREIQGYLATWAAGFDFVVWQRMILIILGLIAVTLIICILRKKNILNWLFGWTAVAAVGIFLFMMVWGVNLYAPGIADDMRLEVNDSYSSSELQEAAEYYLASANALAAEVDRDENGLCAIESFDAAAANVGSGFHNMTRTCYVFGGSVEAPKPMAWSSLLRNADVTGMMVPFTGEATVNTELLPVNIPFEMSRQAARRMSIATIEDASFAAILACMSSDDVTYQYAGYYMAYVYCYHALNNTNPAKVAQITTNIGDGLKADLIANGTLDGSAPRGYMTLSGDELSSEARNTVADLLVAWHIRQTTPVVEEDEGSTHGADVVPAPQDAIRQAAMTETETATEPSAEETSAEN